MECFLLQMNDRNGFTMIALIVFGICLPQICLESCQNWYRSMSFMHIVQHIFSKIIACMLLYVHEEKVILTSSIKFGTYHTYNV